MDFSISGAQYFDTVAQPVLLSSKGQILYMNPAARKLAEQTLSPIAVGSALPAEFPQEADTAAVVTLGGTEWQVRTHKLEQGILYQLTPLTNTDCLNSENAYLLSVGLKSTMNTMLASLEALQDELVETELERNRERFATLNRSYYRLLHTIDSLSVYSRMTSTPARELIWPEAIEIGEFCREVCADLRPLIEMAGHRLTLKLDDALPPLYVKGERRLLERLLCQLCANALHAGGEIIISLSKQQGRASLTVQDNGSGIPDEVLNRPFTAAPVPSGAYSGGVGFGLAICYRIAHLHGGGLVLSRSRQGTSAAVSLPLLHPEDTDLELHSKALNIVESISLPLLELSKDLPAKCYDPAVFL